LKVVGYFCVADSFLHGEHYTGVLFKGLI